METFSTSVLNTVLPKRIAQLNNRYYNQDLRSRRLCGESRSALRRRHDALLHVAETDWKRNQSARSFFFFFVALCPVPPQRHGMGVEKGSPPTAAAPARRARRRRERKEGRVCWLERHPFWERFTSAGELLHTHWRIPTFMATVLLSVASHILSGVWVSQHSVA